MKTFSTKNFIENTKEKLVNLYFSIFSTSSEINTCINSECFGCSEYSSRNFRSFRKDSDKQLFSIEVLKELYKKFIFRQDIPVAEVEKLIKDINKAIIELESVERFILNTNSIYEKQYKEQLLKPQECYKCSRNMQDNYKKL